MVPTTVGSHTLPGLSWSPELVCLSFCLSLFICWGVSWVSAPKRSTPSVMAFCTPPNLHPILVQKTSTCFQVFLTLRSKGKVSAMSHHCVSYSEKSWYHVGRSAGTEQSFGVSCLALGEKLGPRIPPFQAPLIHDGGAPLFSHFKASLHISRLNFLTAAYVELLSSLTISAKKLLPTSRRKIQAFSFAPCS